MSFLTTHNDKLLENGPIIEVYICPPHPITLKLKQAGKQVPAFKAIALIDTGATATCISQEIVNRLKLIAHDIQTVHTAAGISQQLLYDIGVGLPISQPNILSIQAPCADLTGQSFEVLIGRDILSMCTLFYNGKDNTFVLHY